MDDEGPQEVGLRLSVIARMLRQEFDRLVADMGITRSQWTMIAVVARKPGATQRQLAEILDMSEASAGRLIDRLCADGLLERVERADDRRARSVNITSKAEPILDQLATIARESQKRIFVDFTEAELENLSALLEKLYVRLSKH